MKARNDHNQEMKGTITIEATIDMAGISTETEMKVIEEVNEITTAREIIMAVMTDIIMSAETETLQETIMEIVKGIKIKVTKRRDMSREMRGDVVLKQEIVKRLNLRLSDQGQIQEVRKERDRQVH